MPDLEVWQVPLPRPWQPVPEVRPPYDDETVQTIAIQFLRGYLHAATEHLLLLRIDQIGPASTPRRGHYVRRSAGVVLPARISVEVDRERGTVVQFTDLELPVEVSLTNRVSRDAAVARVGWLLDATLRHALGAVEYQLKGADLVADYVSLPPPPPPAEQPKAHRERQQRLVWRMRFRPADDRAAADGGCASEFLVLMDAQDETV